MTEMCIDLADSSTFHDEQYVVGKPSAVTEKQVESITLIYYNGKINIKIALF